MTDLDPAVVRVVGRRPEVTRNERRVGVIALLAAVAFAMWFVRNGHWPNLLTLLVVPAGNLARRLRPATTVDATGIRRPWHRRREIAWSEVVHVVAPPPGALVVRLTLTDGKTVDLADIAAAESAAVAALGAKPMVKPARPILPPPKARRTDRDVEADVARRAQALAERGAVLDAEYRRIRRGQR